MRLLSFGLKPGEQKALFCVGGYVHIWRDEIIYLSCLYSLRVSYHRIPEETKLLSVDLTLEGIRLVSVNRMDESLLGC